MKENELEYYSKVANWDFSQINYEEEVLTDWNYFEQEQTQMKDHYV